MESKATNNKKNILITLFAMYIDFIYLNVMILPLAIVVLYYAFFDRKFRVLSFGEYLSGRVLLDDNKR